MDYAKKAQEAANQAAAGMEALNSGITKVEDLYAEGTGDLPQKVNAVAGLCTALQSNKDRIVSIIGEGSRETIDKVDGVLNKANEYKKKIEDANGDEGILAAIQEEWKAEATKLYEEQGLAEMVNTGKQFKENVMNVANMNNNAMANMQKPSGFCTML